MKLSTTLILQAIMALTSAHPSPELKHPGDGIYDIITYLNGTVERIRTGDINYSLAQLPVSPNAVSTSPNPLSKRFTVCWGADLDHTSVDVAAQNLRAWSINRPQYPIYSGTKNYLKSFTVGNANVYYCIDAKNASGSLEYYDVDFALGQMDASCPAYTSSYWHWDNGSKEIVGKALWWTPVCQGG